MLTNSFRFSEKALLPAQHPIRITTTKKRKNYNIQAHTGLALIIPKQSWEIVYIDSFISHFTSRRSRIIHAGALCIEYKKLKVRWPDIRRITLDNKNGAAEPGKVGIYYGPLLLSLCPTMRIYYIIIYLV